LLGTLKGTLGEFCLDQQITQPQINEEKDENGKKFSTKTEWQVDALIAETKMHSGKLTETYQVSSDGKQLTVVSRCENSSLPGPVSIRRVYDMENAERDSQQ
jgi:hypothetical protein